MSSNSTFMKAYEDPSMLVISQNDFFWRLHALYSYAAIHSHLENYSYGAVDFLFSMFAVACKDPGAKSVATSHSQGPLEGKPVESEKDATERYPDLTFLSISDQSILPTAPSYLYPAFGFAVEVKPLEGKSITQWFDPAGHASALQEVAKHIWQVSEQCYFAFQHHRGDLFHMFLLIGPYFTLFRFKRPGSLNHLGIPSHKSSMAAQLSGDPVGDGQDSDSVVDPVNSSEPMPRPTMPRTPSAIDTEIRPKKKRKLELSEDSEDEQQDEH